MSKKSIFYTTADLNYSDVSPTLDLNFVENQKVPPFVNVTRNSQTTYVDKFGILRTADINQPIFEWDPITGKCLGARIWGVVTNLLTHSENLATGFNQQNSSVSSDAVIAPSNALTGDTLIPSVLSSSHASFRSNISLSASTAYTFSIFAKAYGYSFAQLTFTSGFNNSAAWVNFNLTGAGSTGFSGAGITSATITAFPGGWYRISVSATSGSGAGAGGPALIALDSDRNSRDPSFAGNGTSGVSFWGAQLQTGSTLAPYVPTTTTVASSTADVWSITGADFSRIWNQSAVTMYGEAERDVVPANDFATIMSANDGSNSNRVRIGYFNEGSAAGTVTYNNVVVVELYPPASGRRRRVALAATENDAACVFNGGNVATDASLTMPTVGQLNIGALPTAAGYLNGYIRRLTIYPKRLTNSQLVQLTE